MPSFGAASRADGDTRLGVSLRCIQDQERRCLVPCGQVIVHHLSRLFHCALAAASLLLDEGASQFQSPVCDLDRKTTSSSDKIIPQFLFFIFYLFCNFSFLFLLQTCKKQKKTPRRWKEVIWFLPGTVRAQRGAAARSDASDADYPKKRAPRFFVLSYFIFLSRINPE